MNSEQPLMALQDDFRRGSTLALPVAGLLVWSALGLAAFALAELIIANLSLYIMAAILPLAYMIDRARGRNLFAGGTRNPLTRLFLWSIAGIAVTVPVIVLGARTGDPLLMVLGMAILAGVIWIPYGWAANDPVGGRHAIVRALGCYGAYVYAPDPYKASAICGVVAIAYLYSLVFMRRG